MHYINFSYTIQDEGTGGEQSGYKDREVDGGEQGDKESGKEVNFYFPGLTPSSSLTTQQISIGQAVEGQNQLILSPVPTIS